MNIHPIFVHFPIALLTIYAIMELLRFKKLSALPYWFYVKAILLITGSVSVFLARYTGEIAEHSIRDKSLHGVIELHSTFALFTFVIFGILALIYIVVWVDRENLGSKIALSQIGTAWNNIVKFAHSMFRSPFMPIMAFIGLIVITTTGALGGAIIYGPDVDPIVQFIYKLFGL